MLSLRVCSKAAPHEQLFPLRPALWHPFSESRPRSRFNLCPSSSIPLSPHAHSSTMRIRLFFDLFCNFRRSAPRLSRPCLPPSYKVIALMHMLSATRPPFHPCGIFSHAPTHDSVTSPLALSFAASAALSMSLCFVLDSRVRPGSHSHYCVSYLVICPGHSWQSCQYREFRAVFCQSVTRAFPHPRIHLCFHPFSPNASSMLAFMLIPMMPFMLDS